MNDVKKLLLLFLLLWNYIGLVTAQELPRRPFMGASIGNITPELKKQNNLPATKGIIINQVFENSSAESADVRPGDVIVKVNDWKVTNTLDFINHLKGFNANDKITVQYYREGEKSNKDIMLRPMPKESNPEFETVYASVRSGNNHLRTIITRPPSTGEFPAVLLVNGVGCSSIDYPFDPKGSLYPVVDSLTKAGFVTMRVEKSGVGDSKGEPCQEYDFNSELNGYKAALASLKAIEYVDASQVFLFGFSMGGVIAPLLANENPVKGLLVFGTVGRSWFDYELENTFRQRILANYPLDSLDEFMRKEEQRLHLLFVEKETPEEIINKHPELEGMLFNYPQHYSYFQQVSDLDIYSNWYKLDTEVLTIHGESDFVSAEADHKLIVEMVNRKGGDMAQYIEVPDTDHWFNHADTEKDSMRQTYEGKNYNFMQTVVNWLEKRIDQKSEL